MNATTERVPSPEMQATEAPLAQLPAHSIPAREPVPATGFGKVVEAVAAVMMDMEPVGKGGTNKFHDYKYARMQDILQMLTPLMGKHGLAVFQHEVRHEMFDDGKCIAIHYQFTVAHKSGEIWPERPIQTGMAPCRTSKGTFDDKSFAKAHTSARKYFLLSLFQIPTEDEDDPDNQKGRRVNTPVPGPDGRVPPHKIEHVGSTFQKWGDSYLAAIRTATTTAELNAWDRENDEALGILSNEPKAAALHAQIAAETEKLMAKLMPPGSAGDGPPATDDKVPSPKGNRPAVCPDPERDPESFIVWADKRMAALTTAVELDLIFENEIDPAADGMMPPDYAAVQNLYELNKKRLGGD